MSKNNGIKNIWKSVKEYQEDPEVLKAKLNEFQEGVTDDFNPNEMNTFSRRKFLAVLASSTAFAATACTNYRDKGEIVPYVERPEEILPGKPTFYASTFAHNGQSYGVLVKTREGRPIKIEGNPDDPINRGKIPSIAHASILNLYDPERLQFPKVKDRKTSWKKINLELIDKIKANSPAKEISLITSSNTSPTTMKVIEEFKEKFFNVKVYTNQLVNNNNRKKAWKKSFNQDLLPAIKWDKAHVILSLESDFLGKDGNTVEARRLYISGRDVANTNSLNKLYSVEAGMSLTGMNSDIRLRLKPQLQYNFIAALINELIMLGSISKEQIDPYVLDIIKKDSLEKIAKNNLLDIAKLKELAKELGANKGKSIVHAGDILPVETHLLVNLLNELLQNQNLYNYNDAFVSHDKFSDSSEIKELVDNMNSGNVGIIIHLDSNPVYELPSELGYENALANVDTVISLSELPNETTSVSQYVLPLHNFLEAWGDHQVRNSLVTLQQPLISPLFDTQQKETILLNWIHGESEEVDRYHTYLKNTIKESVYNQGDYAASFETFWFSILHDGVVKVTSNKVDYVTIDQSIIPKKKNNETKGLTLLLHNNYSFGTGQYANNGWLQELPHPISKVTWDNYAAIASATAEQYNISNNDVIKVSVNDKEISLPALIQPGMAENTIVIEMGYGRTNSGEVANEVGFSINTLLSADDLSQYIFDEVSITKTDEEYELASTQEHHSLDDEFIKDFHRIRQIIQEGTLEEYKSNPNFLKEHKHEIFSITESHEYKDEKWAMSIDLNKCLGCSECITSCNVENNVPIVGKDQVSRGREMQWLRIDRYYSGTPEEPIVSTQPMLCQHCDDAPCENVCPVNATNHSPDGLNQMAYNRCVGTRYCANNCPYKVRRFNFYDFRDNFADSHYDNKLINLVHNPEVTVRSRGVIEKCSFCIQTIMEVRETAIREGREILTDEIKTSCQTACPTEAIVFGDSNNPDSAVKKNREHELSYHVLEELNIKPNVTYLAKIRNTRTEDA